MAEMRSKAVKIDTVDLKQELQSLGKSTRDMVANLTKESLEAQVNAINVASTMRASAVQAASRRAAKGTVDAPLSKAEVKIDDRAGGLLIVYVDHDSATGINLFNLLDAGRPTHRSSGSRAIFPQYEGNLTPFNGAVSGDPAIIAQQINANNIHLKTDSKGKLLFSTAGYDLHGFQPRNFYQAAADWVSEEMLKRDIVTASRRTKYKLKKDDVTIQVSQRRFKT